jgi:hypothetical protein
MQSPSIEKRERSMSADPEEILRDILRQREGQDAADLQDIMRTLRARCGRFTQTEAVLHMMDALIIEARERRGW